jgi:hypothetical protein
MRLCYGLGFLIIALFLISNASYVEGTTTCSPSWNTQEIITDDGVFTGVDTDPCQHHCYVVQITSSVESIKITLTGPCRVKLYSTDLPTRIFTLGQNETDRKTYTDPTPGNFIVLIDGSYTLIVNYTYEAGFLSEVDLPQFLMISITVGSVVVIVISVILIIRIKK